MALRGSTGFANTYTETKTTGTVYKGSRPRADARNYVVFTVVGAPTGGTFTISFGGQTTAATAYNATPATVKTNLEALSTIGDASADITSVSGANGGPYTVNFTAGGAIGPAQHQTNPTFTASGAALTGGTGMGVTVD